MPLPQASVSAYALPCSPAPAAAPVPTPLSLPLSLLMPRPYPPTPPQIPAAASCSSFDDHCLLRGPLPPHCSRVKVLTYILGPKKAYTKIIPELTAGGSKDAEIATPAAAWRAHRCTRSRAHAQRRAAKSGKWVELGVLEVHMFGCKCSTSEEWGGGATYEGMWG